MKITDDSSKLKCFPKQGPLIQPHKLGGWGAGDWTQGLVHAKRALYHYTTTPAPLF